MSQGAGRIRAVTNIGAPRDRTTASRLGGGEIGMCLTRLHHDRFATARPLLDEVRLRDAQRGIEHENRVLAAIADIHRDVAPIASGAGAEERTLNALDAGASLIVGGRLGSTDGALVGAPDLLVRLEGGYAPLEVKNHKVAGARGIPATATVLKSITATNSTAAKFRGNRRRDLLQVAHYRHLLFEVGHASSSPVGGVIGSEEPYGCLWVDLTTGEPSIMEEYDSLQSDALDAIRFGSENPGTPRAEPWWRGECSRCDWETLCRAQLTARNDVTLLTRVGHDDRAALAGYGITRIDEVAALDPADERLPESSVVYQARARTAGRLLRRDDGAGALAVPSARREVDFDIETYNGQIYLAGFLTTVDGMSTYEPIVDWTGTEEGERNLVEAMFARLATLSDGDTITQHWTEYEQRTLKAAGERHRLSIPGFHSVGDWFEQNAVDLCDWTRRNLASPNGYSLKAIAPLCGFTWRDEDPGGRQSEIWFERMLTGDVAMRDRILVYNEDDVIAQREVRRWVRAQDDGGGPGTAIPSVHTWPLELTDSH